MTRALAWVPNALAALALSAGALSGCIEIAPPAYREEERIVPSCDVDTDCGDDRCDEATGFCVAQMRRFPGLMLDVVPEAVDTGFGGFHIQALLTELATDDAEPQTLVLDQPPAISGLIGIEPCGQLLPSVRVTFVPRLTRLGLPVGRYTTVSKRDVPETASAVVYLYEFSGIPFGSYDVYWEDSGDVKQVDPECEIVPQVFRNVQVTGASSDLPLIQSAAIRHRVQVLIPYSEQLEGWRVDVVHSVTGEVLSTSRVITAAMVRDAPDSDSGAKEFALELKLADVQGVDYVRSSEAALLRLSPPAGALRPTISFSLFGLVAVTPDVAHLAPLSRFGDSVQFSAWVWEDTDEHAPVQGEVEFVAVELSDTQGQGRLEFSVTTPIDPDGLVTAALLPGVYRARVRPNEVGATVFETMVPIWADVPQKGGVLSVPKGSSVAGRLRVPYSLVSPEGTLIQALGLTSVSLAQTFRPRAASTLADADGRFRLSALDCGACDADNEANFTLVAKPPADLGLPWAIKSRVAVRDETQVDFDLSFPALHLGQLKFKKRNGNVGAFPGALIRALALVDAEGQVLPLGTPGCFEQTPEAAASGAQCARGTVEVAQTRSGNDGQFRLMLPTDLAEFGH